MESSEAPKFAPGDIIVDPICGPFRIIEIVETTMGGPVVQCYRCVPLSGEGYELDIDVNSGDLRLPVDEDMASMIIESVKVAREQGPAKEVQTQMERSRSYHARVCSSDILQIASVVGEILFRRNHGTRMPEEDRYMEIYGSWLAVEISLALQISQKSAERLLVLDPDSIES